MGKKIEVVQETLLSGTVPTGVRVQEDGQITREGFFGQDVPTGFSLQENGEITREGLLGQDVPTGLRVTGLESDEGGTSNAPGVSSAHDGAAWSGAAAPPSKPLKGWWDATGMVLATAALCTALGGTPLGGLWGLFASGSFRSNFWVGFAIGGTALSWFALYRRHVDRSSDAESVPKWIKVNKVVSIVVALLLAFMLFDDLLFPG